MKILGLDLGISSIGWALIETTEDREPIKILSIGSRIIPLTEAQINDFNRGKGETVCSIRTAKRSARRNSMRYKMRRQLLSSCLKNLGLMPDPNLMTRLSPLEIWGLRANAPVEGKRLSLKEIGRVLLFINQKRGYRHSRKDSSKKEDTEYVSTINHRYQEIKTKGLTVGQELFRQLTDSATTTSDGHVVVSARLKEQVFPREAYLEEFDRIMANQRKFYPNQLTNEAIEDLRNAIFYQRPLKSCKHLVSVCEFKAKEYLNRDGKKVIGGPKVAPRTSPLSQVCRLYEAVNNIRLTNIKNKGKKFSPSLFDDEFVPKEARLLQETYVLTSDEKNRIIEYLTHHDQLTSTQLLKLLGLKKSDGFVADKAVVKGLKGNVTFIKIKEALGNYPEANKFLQFNLLITDSKKIDQTTGLPLKEISDRFIEEPLYRLWHLLYSVSDEEELKHNLQEKFGITDKTVLDRLAQLDFTSAGYTNKSAKMMREILPYLMEGYDYASACEIAGINHSFSLTKEQNDARILSDRLSPVESHSLRQPLIEKVLNQMVNIVNALIEKHGEINEVRVELARTLKSSASERSKLSEDLIRQEKENKRISSLIEQYGVIPTRKRIQKYKLWEEANQRCMYCNQTINVVEWLKGIDSEVEHIIPRSIFFDDSFSNRTCSCRACNKAKSNLTAYDFMHSKGQEAFDVYVAKINELFEQKKISKTKRNRLLTSKEEIPTDFLERDLRLTQYISRKACEILREAIRDVWASSGTVTSFLRHIWGYDNIIHDLNLDRFRSAGLVEIEEAEYKGAIIKREKIIDWNKRRDHRHHAIDALTIALTRQRYIERLNNLNAYHPDIFEEMSRMGTLKTGESLVTQWCKNLPHFSTHDVAKSVNEIAISTKSDKKLSSTKLDKKLSTSGKGNRLPNKSNSAPASKTLIPRGPLHEDSIHGKILLPDGDKKLSFAFENIDLICDEKLRHTIRQMVNSYNGDWETALRSLGKCPLIHPVTKKVVESVACWREEYVIKKKINTLSIKQIPKVVDFKIRTMLEERAKLFSDDKKFQASLNENPLRLHSTHAPIRSVKLKSGYDAKTMIPLSRDQNNNAFGFACNGDIHHVAFYLDQNGKILWHSVSFWTAILRKRAGIPVVIKDPKEAVDLIMMNEDENLRESLAKSSPSPYSQIMSKFKKFDTFILGLSDEDFSMALQDNDKALLASHLYRVQQANSDGIVFRLHSDPSTEISKVPNPKAFYRIRSYKALKDLNPKEVKVDIIGNIHLS